MRQLLQQLRLSSLNSSRSSRRSCSARVGPSLGTVGGVFLSGDAITPRSRRGDPQPAGCGCHGARRRRLRNRRRRQRLLGVDAAGAFSGEVDAAPSAVSVAPARRLEREPPHRRFGLDGCTKLSRAELVQDVLSLRACERAVENHLRDDLALLMSRKRMQHRDGLLNLRDRVRVRHGSNSRQPPALHSRAEVPLLPSGFCLRTRLRHSLRYRADEKTNGTDIFAGSLWRYKRTHSFRSVRCVRDELFEHASHTRVAEAPGWCSEASKPGCGAYRHHRPRIGLRSLRLSRATMAAAVARDFEL